MQHNVYGILLESTQKSYTRELFGKICSFVKERGPTDLVLGGSVANILREMVSEGLLVPDGEPEYDKLAAGIDRAFKISPSNLSELEVFTPEKCREIRYKVICGLLSELDDVPFYTCRVSDLSAICKSSWKILSKGYTADKRARLEPEPVEHVEELPQEIQLHVPQEVHQEILLQVPQEVPQEIPLHVPQEVPQEIPLHVPQEVPQEIPLQVPQEVPQEIPLHMQQEKVVDAQIKQQQEEALVIVQERRRQNVEATRKYIEEKAREHEDKIKKQEEERRREQFYEDQRKYAEMVRKEREAEEIRRAALEHLRNEMKAELK